MPTRHVPIPGPAVISGRVDPATEKRILAIAARARRSTDAHLAAGPGPIIISKRDELYQQAEAMTAPATKPKENAPMTTKPNPRQDHAMKRYPDYMRLALEAMPRHTCLADLHRAAARTCQENAWPHPKNADALRWYCKSRCIPYPSLPKAAIARRAGLALTKLAATTAATPPADPGPVPGAAPAPGPATAPPPATAVGTPADSPAWDIDELIAGGPAWDIDKLIAGGLAWQQRAEKAERELAEAQATIETLHQNYAALHTVTEEQRRLHCQAAEARREAEEKLDSLLHDAASPNTILRLRLPAPARLVCVIGEAVVQFDRDGEERKVCQRGEWLDIEVPR